MEVTFWTPAAGLVMNEVQAAVLRANDQSLVSAVVPVLAEAMLSRSKVVLVVADTTTVAP